jgi:hypothetical protein
MAETTDEIKREIEARRGQLAQSINELEHRVKDSIDFNQQFRRHTFAFLGVAFGGGLLFGLITGGGRRDSRHGG